MTAARRPGYPPRMGDMTEIAGDSFCDIVAEHARAQGDVIAFTYGDEETSFAALDEGANRVANGLVALGVQPGERVAFLGKNHPLYFEALLGAARIGAVMTPVNWRLAPPEVAYILDNSQARVVFVGEGFATVIEQLRADVPHVAEIIGIDAPTHDGADYRTWRDSFPATPPAHRIKSEDDALQLYTSGTTGKPKGAVMTHGSILSSRDAAASGEDMRAWQEPIPGDVTLLAMPCFHISGTGTGIGTMVAGSNSIVLPEYDPAKALDLIQNYNISKIFLVPAAIQILLNHPKVNEVDFSRLKYVTYGASPIPLELMREAMRVLGCGFVQMYGMTETSGTIVALDPEDHVPRRLAPDAECRQAAGRAWNLKIIDEAEERGCPWHGGRNRPRAHRRTCAAYWNNPPGSDRRHHRRGWLAAHRGRGLSRRRRLPLYPRPGERHDHLGRRECLPGRSRKRALFAPQGRRCRGDRRAGCQVGRGGQGLRGGKTGRGTDRSRTDRPRAAAHRGLQMPQIGRFHPCPAAQSVRQDPAAANCARPIGWARIGR